MAKDKKRKRESEPAGENTSKKSRVSFANDHVRVSMVGTKDEMAPVLAVPVGMAVPHHSMKAYTKRPRDTVPNSQQSLILHSSEHPCLDYIGQEDFGNTAEALLKHYIGVYDPKDGSLKLVQARRVALRSTLRPTQEEIDEAAAEKAAQTMGAQRHALGLEFGTKRAKKMIASMTENAIVAGPSGSAPSAASKALLASVGESIANMPTVAEMDAQAAAAKPKPKANLDANNAKDVYSLERLVAREILEDLDVQPWIDETQKGKGVEVASRYVARRLGSAAGRGDVLKLKVMRYMLICIEYMGLCKKVRGGARMPKPLELKKMAHPLHVVDGVRKRFLQSGANELSQWDVDNLITHVMAMALYVDDLATDTTDLKDDFRLEPIKAQNYFRELGCKISAPTDREKTALRLTAAESKTRKYARLQLPLEFPDEGKKKKRFGGR
ncbi:RNA polymerase I associated factor, A49-like protein [Microthyrium microscopicum]|uniref:RNA polymerase I associated factor, A49-like protein n=1 Tax=Microthyrium microscopicum TaxID=703497 RepID=A0A6A6U2M7_9PEZI|nr:RNA polymerase I associated factor, A49-like protein [Microthyrium microscopicum]